MYEWNFFSLWEYRHILVTGLQYTLGYTVFCVVFGLLIGAVCALGMLVSPAPIARLLRVYVEIFRCTPVLIQLIWFYYALPVLIGIEISPSMAAMLSLSLYGGAFYAEIIRGGLISIEAGQHHAGSALGMTKLQIMQHIILPQACKRMVPPLVNQSILQLKNTSLLSVLAIPDLLYQGQIIAHHTYRSLEIYSLIALIYFLILFPLTRLAKFFETRIISPKAASVQITVNG